MISNQIKIYNNAAASYKTGLLHFYAAAAVVYALRHFFETIDLLVLKRDHYNEKESDNSDKENSDFRFNFLHFVMLFKQT